MFATAVAGAALFEKWSRGVRKRATNSCRTRDNTGSSHSNLRPSIHPTNLSAMTAKNTAVQGWDC